MSEMEDLYRDIILDHNKRPRNFGSLDGANRQADGHNPLCGDEVTVFLEVKDGRIAGVSFDGEGCAISKASASLMTLALKGKPVADAEAEIERVVGMLTDPEQGEVDLMEVGDVASLSGVRKFPARIKCATLAWHAAEAALQGEDSISTE